MSWPSNAARTKNWGTEVLTDADLEGQFDLLCQYFIDSLNSTTGHGHTGGTNDGPKITLTTGVQGTLPIANGGTGVTTLAALLNLVYPVGSIYANYSDSTNPGTLLGFGTWVAIADRVLLGLGSTYTTPSGTGGASTVTLTTNELPAHTHTYAADNGGSNSTASLLGRSGSPLGTGSTSSAGSGAAFSIMNPYQIVYLWRRSV